MVQSRCSLNSCGINNCYEEKAGVRDNGEGEKSNCRHSFVPGNQPERQVTFLVKSLGLDNQLPIELEPRGM